MRNIIVLLLGLTFKQDRQAFLGANSDSISPSKQSLEESREQGRDALPSLEGKLEEQGIRITHSEGRQTTLP